MNFCKTPAAILFFLLFIPFTWAQNSLLTDISEQKLKDHVYFLASDSLQGRGFGTEVPGIDIAADYIQNTISAMNLNSPGAGYFQPFSMYSVQPDRQNSFLKVFNKNWKEKQHIQNFIALNQNTETMEFEGELVFAGFGWKDSVSGYNDFEDIDIKEKVVLYSAGTPESFLGGYSGQWNNPQERQKTEEIFRAGASAIILVTSIQDEENKTYNQLVQWNTRQRFSADSPYGHEKNSPLILVSPEAAEKLIGKKKKWKQLLNSVAENETPETFAIKNNQVHFRSVLISETIKSRNVVGIIEGSDPELRNECVLFMAHYDHLGMNDKGEIFNGADDNASGVATLLEIARVFTELKPKRSIVFLWPTAEEVGLIGSEYYSKNPVFPLENTVACINLDMVGRVYEERDSVWDNSPKPAKDFDGIYALVNNYDPELKEITDDACSELGLIPDYSLPSRFFHTSDHYHFHRNKVPVLNLSTGYTADYHRITDEAWRIRPDKMKRVAELCVRVALELANR
jgi:hypothetical protein